MPDMPGIGLTMQPNRALVRRFPNLLILLVFASSGCAGPARPGFITQIEALAPLVLPAGERLNVVATTTIAGDVLAHVGGDVISLKVLLKPGGDPHSFQARPSDLLAASKADILFVSGFSLEGSMLKSIRAAAPGVPVVELSEGLIPLSTQPEDEHGGSGNPHVWLDPANVMRWVENAALALGRMDPDHREIFTTNAQGFKLELASLQAWIETQIAALPVEHRLLVTDHRELEYFAQRYGFEIAGALVASFSSDAEPSARELADLETRLLEFDTGAIFVSSTVNPKLAERVAADTGLKVVRLYTGSLSDPAGPAPDYISLMKYNVRAIIDALR